MLNVNELLDAITPNGKWEGEVGFNDEYQLAEWLVHQERGVYDPETDWVYWADMNADGDIYGIQFCSINPEDAWGYHYHNPWCKSLMEYANETRPAPGTGAKNRLSFYSVDTVSDAIWVCRELAHNPWVGDDSFERLKDLKNPWGPKHWYSMSEAVSWYNDVEKKLLDVSCMEELPGPCWHLSSGDYVPQPEFDKIIKTGYEESLYYILSNILSTTGDPNQPKKLPPLFALQDDELLQKCAELYEFDKQDWSFGTFNEESHSEEELRRYLELYPDSYTWEELEMYLDA